MSDKLICFIADKITDVIFKLRDRKQTDKHTEKGQIFNEKDRLTKRGTREERKSLFLWNILSKNLIFKLRDRKHEQTNVQKKGQIYRNTDIQTNKRTDKGQLYRETERLAERESRENLYFFVMF